MDEKDRQPLKPYKRVPNTKHGKILMPALKPAFARSYSDPPESGVKPVPQTESRFARMDSFGTPINNEKKHRVNINIDENKVVLIDNHKHQDQSTAVDDGGLFECNVF